MEATVLKLAIVCIVSFAVVMVVAMLLASLNRPEQRKEPSTDTRLEQAAISANEAGHSYMWHYRWFGEPDDEETGAVMLHGQTIRVHLCFYRAEGMMAVYTQDEDPESRWVWNCYAAASGPEISTVDPIDEQLFMARMAGRARNVGRIRRIRGPRDE